MSRAMSVPSTVALAASVWLAGVTAAAAATAAEATADDVELSRATVVEILLCGSGRTADALAATIVPLVVADSDVAWRRMAAPPAGCSTEAALPRPTSPGTAWILVDASADAQVRIVANRSGDREPLLARPVPVHGLAAVDVETVAQIVAETARALRAARVPPDVQPPAMAPAAAAAPPPPNDAVTTAAYLGQRPSATLSLHLSYATRALVDGATFSRFGYSTPLSQGGAVSIDVLGPVLPGRSFRFSGSLVTGFDRVASSNTDSPVIVDRLSAHLMAGAGWRFMPFAELGLATGLGVDRFSVTSGKPTFGPTARTAASFSVVAPSIGLDLTAALTADLELRDRPGPFAYNYIAPAGMGYPPEHLTRRVVPGMMIGIGLRH